MSVTRMMGESVWPREWDGAAFAFGGGICCRVLGQAAGTAICKVQTHEKRFRNVMKIFQLNLSVLFE